MDYFEDGFHTFLGLNSVIYLAVNGTVTSLPVFIQNILNSDPKTNKAFTGWEQHGGKWLMTIVLLGWSSPLKVQHPPKRVSIFCVALASRCGAHCRPNRVGKDVRGGSLQRWLGPHSSAHLSGHAHAGRTLPLTQGLPGASGEGVAELRTPLCLGQ